MTEVPILEGRDFREIWEDHLTKETRHRVRDAVRKGQVIQDRGLASLAVSLARQNQAQFVPMAVASVAMVFVWVMILASLLRMPSTGATSWWHLIAVLWIVMVPLRLTVWLLIERPRFRRAEAVNLQRLVEDH